MQFVDDGTKVAVAVYENTNGVPMSDGKNLHMEIGPHDIASRIITVGSLSRAEKIATFFDLTAEVKTITSSRGFTTITGSFRGTAVSVVSIGMGVAMMDFFVSLRLGRETRAIVSGPMVVVRFGTCGGISDDAPAGKIVVATGGSGYVTRNPDAFLSYYTADTREAIASNHAITPYVMHVVAPSNSTLSTAVSTELISALGEECVKAGSNVTADSFYSSQGRIDDNFDDGNKDLIASILSSYPDAKTLEMETFMLLHLARCSKMPIAASAAAIVVANRRSADVIDAASLEMLEMEGGKAILKAICSFEI